MIAAMNDAAHILGVVGWSGSGKTHLLARLIHAFSESGLRVATLKHAHHSFDVDVPGKDSHTHRMAGASEVIVSSSRRWVQMHEIRGGLEATLAELLRRLSPCDLVLIEGFKGECHPKLEVFRPSLGKTPLYPDDPRIVAVASDRALPDARVPVVSLDDTAAVAALVRAHAEPLESIIAALEAFAQPRG
jgi:molybdopterin-guanine dinucleotide biosynthesis adapter protein